MKNIIFIKIAIIFYFLYTSFLAAHSNKKKSLKSHEHGVGIFNIAQEGNILLFEFEIPGADIVGFEYEAKSESDKEKVANSLNLLAEHKNMFVLPASAECQSIESKAKVINEGKHSEFIAIYKLSCKQIEPLKRIYIKYFKSFELSKKLNIKIFGNNKKSAYVIDRSKKILNVKNHF